MTTFRYLNPLIANRHDVYVACSGRSASYGKNH